MTEGNVEFEPKSVSREALATLGEGHIALCEADPFRGCAGLVPPSTCDPAPGIEAVRVACCRRHADHA